MLSGIAAVSAHHLYLNGTEVKDLVIPDGITSIGSFAFYGCSGLNSVTIPNSVTSIGGWAFNGCSGLTSVTIPDGVTSIGSFAFYGCSGLTSVTIPNGVTSIGSGVFRECSGLISVTIPNGVTSIAASTFSGCSGLTSVTIPDGVTSIGSEAFYGCSGLTSVTIPDGVTSIGSEAFSGCSGLTSVTIPDGVTSIGSEAFSGCSGLTSVTIPNGVTSIQDAFTKCSNLALMVVLSSTPPKVTTIGATKLVMVPTGFEGNYANAEVWKNAIIIPYEDPAIISFKDQNVKEICVEHWDKNGDGELDTWEAMSVQDISNTFKSNVTIMKFDEFEYFKAVTTIGYGSFCKCVNLRSITLPKFVNNIAGGWNQESGAFAWCSSLISIDIPCTINSIGGYAFFGCSKLSAVHIEDLTAWCNISFADYNNSNPLSVAHHLLLNGEEVTDLEIPDGITSINVRAFDGASSLTSVVIPESVTSIGNRAFRDCSGLTEVTIPASINLISENVFEGSGLTAVDITDLGAWCDISFANANCNPLNQLHHLRLNGEEVTDMTIPDDVTEIGNYAFYGCTGFTSVNIPIGVTKIGINAFSNCGGLGNVTLPEGVTTVGDNAFNTGYMKNVTIPSTLYGFGNTAFGNSLRSVAVTTDEPPLIGATAFPNRTSAVLIVPKGCTSAYRDEMYWQDFKTIVEYPGGDVNADGDINMVDVVDIVRFVVGTPSVNFIEVMADLNNSNSVNVADAVVLVNEIAGDVNYAKPMWAPVVNDDVLALAGDGNRLSLLMEGNGQYAAFQFDLWLPTDLDVTDVQLNDSRRQGHQLLYNKVGNGHYRVAAISTAANSFSGNSGELLGLTLDGFATDDIRMDNIHFVTTRGADIAFDDLGVNHGSEGVATGITSPAKEKESETIYNLNGQRLTVPQKGLNIIGGKKVTVK